jgi:hypothetical protein
MQCNLNLSLLPSVAFSSTVGRYANADQKEWLNTKTQTQNFLQCCRILHFSPEDGSIMLFRNIGIEPKNYTAQPK